MASNVDHESRTTYDQVWCMIIGTELALPESIHHGVIQYRKVSGMRRTSPIQGDDGFDLMRKYTFRSWLQVSASDVYDREI